MNKVIVIAGVFDPVHNGHIAALDTALSRYPKSRAVVVAEKVPQHKSDVAPYQHRLQMLKLAFADYQNVEVLEAPTSEHKILPFFTWLKGRFPNREFIWLMGTDVINELASWPDAERLHELGVIELLTVARDEQVTIATERIEGVPVRVVQAPQSTKHISSRKLRENRTESSDTPKTVRTYIIEKKLYT